MILKGTKRVRRRPGSDSTRETLVANEIKVIITTFY